MPFNKKLADKILKVARERFPEPIVSFQELQNLIGLTDQPWNDEWKTAIEALEAEHLIQFKPVATGIDEVLRGFINLTVTARGRTTDIAA